MNFIVAVDKGYGIGKNNDLLYDIKGDMQYFKKVTTGKVVVMGDKTLLSFPSSKPLKNRTNIVVSIDPNFSCEGAIVVHSFREMFEEIKKYKKEDVFLIGGALMYNSLLPYCEKAYITKIEDRRPADKYLINIDDLPNWEVEWESERQEENGVGFRFTIYKNLKCVEID